jgi:glucose-1-phosphate adenylyltransferase
MSLQTGDCNRDMAEIASIILAGGQGTRLHPLTKNRCKPSVCYGGRYRLIDIPISNSLNAKIQHIFVISQYFTAPLHEHIQNTYPSDFFKGLKIQLLSPAEAGCDPVSFKGTADAIRQNLAHFEASSADYFLILSGDQLYNIDFGQMLDFAKQKDADLTIASLPVQEKEAKRMGLLNIDSHCAICDFIEKPSDPKVLASFALGKEKTHYLGSMGIYIFKRKALFDLVGEQGDDFGKDLIPIQVKKGKTVAYVYKGYWEDIGTIASYYQANIALTQQENCLNTYDAKNPIFTPSHHLPNPLIHHTAVHRSIIGPGTVIEAQEISDSVVGTRLKIGKGTIIRNSVLLGSSAVPTECSIGENCLLERVILDENATIGNHVQLTNQEGLNKYEGDGIFIRDGIIIVTSGTKVPDHFVL